MNSLQDKGCDDSFSDFRVEAHVEQALVDFVCNSGVALFTLLQKFEHNVLFNYRVFYLLHRTGFLDGLGTYQHVQQLEGDAEHLYNLLPASLAHHLGACLYQVLKCDSVIFNLTLSSFVDCFINFLQGDFFKFPVRGANSSGELLSEYEFNVGVRVLLHLDITFVELFKELQGRLLIAGGFI